MIKTIIFDFGNVFIDLDIEGGMQNALTRFKINAFTEDLLKVNKAYEKGLISTYTFLEYYSEKFPDLVKNELMDIWNAILKSFPKHRMNFLKQLHQSSKYKLILLSNTNELHINWIKEHISFYEEFKNCFDAFYLSNEIHLSKPNPSIYEFVLNENNLNPMECLFIDDNESNIISANNMGIHVWHINPETEDISQLFTTRQDLFN